MKKQFVALTAAILTTLFVGVAMFAIGRSALFNPNWVSASNSSGSAKLADVNASPQVQIQQLQALITQYQARETEYQKREQQYQALLDQANAQTQQYQQQIQQVQVLLQALQQRGLITVTNDGRIFIN
jgi:TolA-binding protein